MSVSTLPKIVAVLACDDHGPCDGGATATCPHCGADGRYVYTFLCEDGSTRAPTNPMTRKHFEQIAKAIRTAANRDPEISRYDIEYIADVIANACQESNPRFDRVRFYQRCGFPDQD